jgi:hypothetical protein
MLADARRQGCLDTELDKLQRAPLLIVDEAGCIPFDPHAANLLPACKHHESTQAQASFRQHLKPTSWASTRKVGP